MGADQAVEAYQSLAKVAWAFRCLKTSRLAIRPVHVYCEDHVRGHVFLCMLAYYVEWHLRRRLAPLLFEDDDRQTAKARRQTAVEEAHVSQQAQRKAATQHTPEGQPVHSFPTLLAHLATLTHNEVILGTQNQQPVVLYSPPPPPHTTEDVRATAYRTTLNCCHVNGRSEWLQTTVILGFSSDSMDEVQSRACLY